MLVRVVVCCWLLLVVVGCCWLLLLLLLVVVVVVWCCLLLFVVVDCYWLLLVVFCLFGQCPRGDGSFYFVWLFVLLLACCWSRVFVTVFGSFFYEGTSEKQS